jgi:hypothetical protein
VFLENRNLARVGSTVCSDFTEVISEEDSTMSEHLSGTSQVPAGEQNAKLYSNFTARY